MTTKNSRTTLKFKFSKPTRNHSQGLLRREPFITSHRGELLNSKSEWRQAKVVRTRTEVVQGGAEVMQHQAGGGCQGEGRGQILGGKGRSEDPGPVFF